MESVPFDTKLISVVQEMIDCKISAVLITSEDKTIGIVTHEDLLKILADSLYPVRDKVAAKMKNWLFKIPIGEVARNLALNGI
ncbi:MAG: CBS domain-containing protein [Bdellovibrio sp.]|nr:CBS domain-containing protein [Bdellovibrio sp.]